MPKPNASRVRCREPKPVDLSEVVHKSNTDACADVPVRTCVGCRQRAAKQDLLRVVVLDQGSGPAVVPDPRRRAPGRGAHLHPTPECLELALRRRAFFRALRVTGGGLASEAVAHYVQQFVAGKRQQEI